MTKEDLEKFIKQGLTQREIAKQFNLSQTTIRYWLKKYNINTNCNLIEYNCIHCGETNPDNFYGRRKTTCKKCFNKQCANKDIQIKIKAIEYKGGKCIHCGYNKYYGALDFHHVNPSEKEMVWKTMKKTTWNKIQKELDKCVLLCRNCHAEEHHKIFLSGNSLAE